MALSPREIINNLVDNPPIPKRLEFGKIAVNIHSHSIAMRMFDYVVYRIAYNIEDHESSPPRKAPIAWLFVSAPRLRDEEISGKTAAEIESLWKQRFMENLKRELSSAINVYKMNRTLFQT